MVKSNEKITFYVPILGTYFHGALLICNALPD